jgi:predicted hydrocarbon binding protein
VHGFIITEIRSYVTEKLGAEAWKALLKEAGLAGREYTNYLEYPDEEVVGMVGAASRLTGATPAAVLEDFGRYVGRDLVRIYRPLAQPHWRTLEFLENVEQTVHEVVRSRNRQARPPALECTRLGADRVVVVYRSPRRLCALARGIIQGLAAHYGEAVEIREETCMHEGAPQCRLVVTRLVPPAAGVG